jgi:hypothetical protein
VGPVTIAVELPAITKGYMGKVEQFLADISDIKSIQYKKC